MTQQNPEPPAPRFTVTGQRESSRVGPDGTVQDIMVVSFATPDGLTGSVSIPAGQYSATSARAAILAKVGLMQSVAGLTG